MTSFSTEIEHSKENIVDADDNSNTETVSKTSLPNICLKYISLILYVGHRVIQTTIIRYASKQSKSKYVKSTFVFICEIEKFIMNLFLVCVEEHGIISGFKAIFKSITCELHIVLKLSIIAAIYVAQNNLALYAISKLDAPTYELTSQLKLLTIAIFSRILLHRRLDRLQWFSLILLIIGIAIVEYEQIASKKTTQYNDPVRGFAAVSIICICSGFAGVFFEKILKHNHISLWILNVQLAAWSIIMSLILIFLANGYQVKQHGMFYGYTNFIWFSTVMYSIGGLLVGIVIKYADTIIKGFALSISIVLSCIIAIYLRDFQLTFYFTIGAIFVFLATIIYSNTQFFLSLLYRKLPLKNDPVSI